MATRTKADLEGRVKRLEGALERAKAKSAALSESLDDALEREKAAAQILGLIRGSRAEIQPVFDGIAGTALRLIGGMAAAVTRFSDGMLHLAAYTSTNKAGDETLKRLFPCPLSQLPGQARAIRSRAPHFVIDTEKGGTNRAVARARGYRSAIFVPLLHNNDPIGVISVARRDPGAFSEHQIQLLKTFADQAVIAIENARLFNDAKEALEQQTAISAVLRVMSTSPTDVVPVLDTVAERAARICEANDVRIFLVDGDVLRYSAGIGSLGALELGEARRMDRGFITGRAVLDRTSLQVDDLTSSEARAQFPLGVELQERFGHRTTFAMPLVREDRALGVILLRRLEVRPFGDKQVELLKTFADQAAIAIENVRLFRELEGRNAELLESLEQQTATSEILRVISSSPTEVQPVFDTIVGSAKRLLGGFSATLRYLADDALELVAFSTTTELGDEAVKSISRLPLADDPVAQVIRDREPCLVRDTESDPGVGTRRREVARARGYRSMLIVPMLSADEAIGAITVTRREPGPFADREVALLQTFADQAVIAIENVRLFKELQARNADLTEALEQQTATAEILRVISGSPTDIQPVLEAVVESAARLCEAEDVVIRQVDGDLMRIVAHVGPVPLTKEVVAVQLSRASISGRAIVDRQTSHIVDVLAAGISEEYPGALYLLYEETPFRTVLNVPLVREDTAIGVIALRRPEVRPFSDKQIKLLETFAAQAVIAFENVRLFKELRARNAELIESLEQQTATSEILRVISSSLTDTQPVFDAIVRSGARLFEGANVSLRLVFGDQVEHVASSHDRDRTVFLLDDDRQPSTRAIRRKEVVVVDDMLTEEWVTEEARYRATRRNFRGLIAAPLMRGDEAIGTLAMNRAAPGPFARRQIDLLKTFADQAVIAIENVRLFKELQERNAEISESLERQTATAEILRVISSSPTDLQPVFDTILGNSMRLCTADRGMLRVFEGEFSRLVAEQGVPAAFSEFRRSSDLLPASPSSAFARLVAEKRVIHIDDLSKWSGYAKRDPLTVASVELGGTRTYLAVPMLKDGALVGAIMMFRQQVRPFTEKQIALLETFADQAVIAIENVRLFKELQAQTDALSRSVNQLSALGEVGQAISSTLDLETVLNTIVSRALQLTGLDSGSIYEYDPQAQVFRLQATENMPDELTDAVRKAPIRVGDGVVGRIGVTHEVAQVPDILDPGYRSGRRDLLVRSGYRALLAVPLLREDQLLGVLLVHRKSPGTFVTEVVDLLRTFATQSALAIQNARLFREIAEKSRQLEVASRHKSQFLASMSHELRTPLNAMLGFNEMILGDIYGAVPPDLKEPLTDIQSSGKHLLRLINNVLDLAKIEAGRMELSLTDYSVQDTVESVRSTLHPLAADKGLEFTVSVAENIPFAYGDFGRITQCLMNLAGNSLKFTKEGSVRIAVDLNGEFLVYRVTDTGIGIAEDKIGSLFTEFKQSDATIASEFGGTGLGLSITRKFVEMHGGRIWVESELGKGSQFIFEIPLRAREGASA